MKELFKKALELASVLLKQREVLIVTHIDADGITSGSIAYQALERVGIEKEIVFTKQLDREVVDIAKGYDFVWFTDIGSGQLDLIKDLNFVITDHHIPKGYHRMQLNPHEFGYDGSIELSGATTTYLVAKFMLRRNLFDFEKGCEDLSALAIVGAVGDLQDSKHGKLIGLNRYVLDDGVKYGYIEVKRDLRLFGKQTRPIVKVLEYTTNPYLPMISGNEIGAVEFLKSLGVDPWKRWIELSLEEKRKVVSGIVRLCMEYGIPFEVIRGLVGECYILLKEKEGTEKRDATEYSTLLNATARYNQAEVGLKVCLGDENAFKRARTLLQNHRRILSEGIRFLDEIGIVELENIQYFNAGNEIPDTVVGIIAGMYYYKANPNKPIVGFAESDRGVKVSVRANHRLVERGVHLAKAVSYAAKKVGGSGGGHSIAAGATIPKGKEKEFLEILDRIIGEQMR